MTSVRTFAIELDHTDQLFKADPIDPFSSKYTPYTAQPAMETVRNEVLMRSPHKGTEIILEITLPNDLLHPGLDEELTTAVRRWVRVQNALDTEASGADGSVGRRLFVLGALTFLVLQMGSYWVKAQAMDGDEYLVDAIGEGMSVASWVMLWFPVQMFTMEVWRSSLRRRRMMAIDHMRVVTKGRT